MLFNMATGLEEEKLWIQTCPTSLKNWPCVTSCKFRVVLNSYTGSLKINVTHWYDNDFFFTDTSVMSVIWNTSWENASFKLETSNQCFFLIVIISASWTCNIFFEFLVSVINHYHINGLYLFWGCFELFYLQIRSDAKYFPLLSKIKD